MSAQPNEFEGRTYDDIAADLLAEIADLLLSGKQDWKTLERLQEALRPKRGPFPKALKGPIPGEMLIDEAATSGTDPDLMGTIRDAMETIYRNKIEEQVRPINPAMWSYTAIGDGTTTSGADHSYISYSTTTNPKRRKS